MHKLARFLPLPFRILFKQFLLRVIDLEALSIQADIPRFLGQFAGVLIMLSLIHALLAFGMIPRDGWLIEQYFIKTMMLVAGLITVISWDSIFPDRRDVMVLSPLPVTPRTILFAKLAASSAILGLAILALNCASGLEAPSRMGAMHRSSWGFLQALAAYWITMIGASLFLYCSVLTVQGITALLLPRKLFLRLSALLQLVAFGLFLAVYFLQPSLVTPEAMAAPGNHWMVACSPSFWFFALLQQVNGSLPANLAWLAWRAWMGMGIALSGAVISLLLCYLRTMKKTVEEPDLMPGSGGLLGSLRLGSALQTAVLLFSIRSLTRSRHHRVAFAFYMAIVFAIALSRLRGELAVAGIHALDTGFLISTYMMVSFAVFGLRSVFSLPISLTANWIWRMTQLKPSGKYIAATRRALLVFGVLPIMILSALLALHLRPVAQTVGHLIVLILLGWIFVEVGLIGFYKVPFTCSYLPGKLNIQFVFWTALLFIYLFAFTCGPSELAALESYAGVLCMAGFLGAIALGLWAFNQRRAKLAVLYFEELPPEVITTLGVALFRPAKAKSDSGSSLSLG